MKTKAILSLLMGLTLFGCNGKKSYTLQERAEIFVIDLNNTVSAFELSIEKVKTERQGYVVFSCIGTGCSSEYLAVKIDSYDPQENAWSYLKRSNSKSKNYHSLEYIGDGLYEDRVTGALFEKTAATSKDLGKMKAMKEQYELAQTASNISLKFSLSQERSLEIAKLNKYWAVASKKAMTDKEVNSFTKELLGFSLTEAKNTYKDFTEGASSSEMDKLIQKAAYKNSISPEHAEKLMLQIFGL